jgi:hypothetical protein
MAFAISYLQLWYIQYQSGSSASLYTTFCVLASLTPSVQIALMFDTEVTLDTAT